MIGYAEYINKNLVKIHHNETFYAEVPDSINLPEIGLKIYSNSSGTYLIHDPIPTASEILEGKRKADEVPKEGKYIDYCTLLGRIEKGETSFIVPIEKYEEAWKYLEEYASHALMFFKIEGKFEPLF